MAWSPQQISERLRLDFPGDDTMRISHEAIYQDAVLGGLPERGSQGGCPSE
jgi:IS30 family transposase